MRLRSDRRQKTQLELDCSPKPTGEARQAGGEEAESLPATRGSESRASTDRVMEEVCEREHLKQALRQVKANRGRAGIDGMSVDHLADHLKRHWPEIRAQLRSGTYKPQPVKRVEIAKPGGGVRPLGVPTVLDRFVQQAVLQVLQPRGEATFSDNSYGFRPGRSAHQAVAQAQQYIAEGYTIVVDLDREKFFDRVNQDRLMGQIAKRVEDKRLLKRIRAFLHAGVMKNGLVSPSVEGTPQGSPLSPLRSNLVRDELDRELERRGHRFVRYADDSNIYGRSEQAGHRVRSSITRFITEKLKVNEAKSAVARPQARKFLGCSFSAGPEVKRIIAPQALDRFKQRIREITRRAKSVSIETTLAERAPYMRGWRNYFGFCETPEVLSHLTRWVRLRLRAALWRQWKTPRRRRAALLALGVGPRLARNTASSGRGPWYLARAKALCVGLSHAHFRSLGLPSLVDGCEPNHLEPPCTDPYARWCGRGQRATAAPMPINLALQPTRKKPRAAELLRYRAKKSLAYLAG